MSAPFHNTVGLTGVALKKAVTHARSQEDAVLLIFLNTRQGWPPHKITEMCNKAGHAWPIWTVRRAITDLTKAGDLIKTSTMVPGDQGVNVHLWIINHKKYPSPVKAEQAKMF